MDCKFSSASRGVSTSAIPRLLRATSESGDCSPGYCADNPDPRRGPARRDAISRLRSIAPAHRAEYPATNRTPAMAADDLPETPPSLSPLQQSSSTNAEV